MKGPTSHKGYEQQRYKYQEFIKQYLKEQNIPLSPWEAVKPLYLRYRARCLKMKPESYKEFLNLCTFKSSRKTKYDIKGELKEGEKAGWENKGKKEATGTRDSLCRIRKDYKLNYKAPPKKEDFELATDYRSAYRDWSYLRDQLSDFEGVKVAIKKVEKQAIESGIEARNYFMMYPFLIRYALRCLSGEYPIEAYPVVLTDLREELEELLNQQRKEEQV